ncbi:cbb3-type cytochrome c oxidase subunit I [Desertibacillus haloalkaliphilus]|uniref:cbb3-type cytochrome c oxidase subunit I n=1 Tax=Desertibacillus haloalkaliphilus TaxID=1328930 RepID=UPI001C25C724|nr:cbb3-type cytochrome c oxidase subunit I [Desertibacillus haloalkaliphilus]MBU8906111.1 cbb3-type cytochrome c oxidase subunit I [Desertibacillus haloalkaliphilus]
MGTAASVQNTTLMTDSSRQNFYLPFSFMITGFLSLLIFSILLLFAGGLFHTSGVRQVSTIAAVHLFVLGWATMFVMGAVYQLVPVVTQNELFSTRLGMVHYFLYTAGSIGLLIGFFEFNTVTLIISGALVIIGTLLFISNILLTIFKTRAWNPILFAMYSALFYLLLTIIFGFLMVINFQYPLFGDIHSSLLASHIWFGFIGWFLFLIIGYSFKMLPMFYLSHGYPERLQKWILVLLHVSLLTITSSFFMPVSFSLTWVGLFLLLVILVVYRLHIKQIISKKFKKNPGKGIALTVRIIDWFIIISAGILVVLTIDTHLFSNLTFLTVISVLYLLGWVNITILGYTSKIIPFLWWTFAFGKRVGKENVPSLHQLIDETKVQRRLVLMAIAVIVLAIGIALQLTTIIMIGQISLALVTIYFLIHLLAVFTYS